MLFDGTSGLLTGPASATAVPFTLSGWAKLTAVPSGGSVIEQVILSIADPAAVEEFWMSFYYQGAADHLRAVAQGGERQCGRQQDRHGRSLVA